MADVNGDMILDLVVGTGPGRRHRRSSPTTATTSPTVVFKTELTRFTPFDAGFTGGVTVAGADIDGNAMADNIIVGYGPGDRVAGQGVLVDTADETGKAPDVFSTFTPYPGSKSGVTLATGMVELGSGRESIVTAPGPGDAPLIKTFRYDLYKPTARAQANGTARRAFGKPNEPTMTSNFLAYDEGYRAGCRCRPGGSRARRAAPRASSPGSSAAHGTVRVWSNGSRLDGLPIMYPDNPNHHEENVKYRQIASFEPFAGGRRA